MILRVRVPPAQVSPSINPFAYPFRDTEDEKDWPYSRLKRMFYIRHILVHELPERVPYKEHEIDLFLDAVSDFILRLTDVFRELIYGTKTLADRLRDVEDEVDKLSKAATIGYEQAKRASSDNPGRLEIIELSQQTWKAFVEAECGRFSNLFEDASPEERSFFVAHRRRHLLTERLKAFPVRAGDKREPDRF
jgi:hypothetical protein